MSKYLVIVESPTKAKTINSILGKEYEVASSMGHVVDLPADKISVDIKNSFNPVYKIIPGKEKIISQLKEKAKGKSVIYLATDLDREGEAISWHIKQVIPSDGKKFLRVTFHEITEDALKEAFAKPAGLNIQKVDAQIARRVLDRIVGYSLSPLLWKKIVRGLSAGRVQSIALKFIIERDKEIKDFKPEITYYVNAKFDIDGRAFEAKLKKYKGKNAVFKSKPEAQACIKDIKYGPFKVANVETRQSSRRPPPPHTTSLLQQEAFNRLKYSAQKTMLIAQKLYEGVTIGEKNIGLVTYMRTDSFHISPKARQQAKDFIREKFGQEYLPAKDYVHRKRKGAQLAHEAIRPTSILRTPQEVSGYLSSDENKLYELIWQRFAASFMKEALYKNTKIHIVSDKCEFLLEGSSIVFDGFLKLRNREDSRELPAVKKDQKVKAGSMTADKHTTKPPPKYNDASFVKLLEDKGIGRPSTYAPTIYTLIRRNYIRREKRAFIPTELGIKVNNLLTNFFPRIMDENFTAQMEKQLDEVEEGRLKWNRILEDFYPGFKKRVDETLNQVKKEVEFVEKKCPKCGGRLVIKWSRKGRFLSCEHFPRCRYAESITTGVKCPECKDGELIERRNRRGQFFYGCSKFPKCNYTSRDLPSDEKNTE
ncbi:MAG: type I DNA topoisomerase [Candidatus Omnitrophica bacterium]|nr:type I DNA topoisomerase [Candidatus Omnitrophota bacterium]MBD3269808.1 type I DNA topoisomerase [Candidatus Omnitrophota bacterium]